MARLAVSATKDASGAFLTSGSADPVNGATVVTTQAAMVAAMAVLVADGVLPTQAHVTTANSALTAFLADVAARPAQTDVVLSVDLANVATITLLRRAVNALLAQAGGNGSITP